MLPQTAHDDLKGRLSNSSPIAKYFKKVFVEEVGAQKPQAFFERVARAIPDYDKDKVVITGDSWQADIQGGINAIWWNHAAKENEPRITMELLWIFSINNDVTAELAVDLCKVEVPPHLWVNYLKGIDPTKNELDMNEKKY